MTVVREVVIIVVLSAMMTVKCYEQSVTAGGRPCLSFDKKLQNSKVQSLG